MSERNDNLSDQDFDELMRGLASPAMTAREAASVLAEVRRAAASAPSTEEGLEVLTLDQAAAVLQVAIADLEAELTTLPHFFVAGQVRIRRSTLEQWMAERERTSTLKHRARNNA